MNKILILLIAVLILTGCNIKENYSVQYSFSNEIITAVKFATKAGGVNLEIPFADFSCDAKSFKVQLSRQEDTFTLTIKGQETLERCSQKFSAEISGIETGTYWLKVIYLKGQTRQEVFLQQFSLTQ
jgi:hypothetical protein